MDSALTTATQTITPFSSIRIDKDVSTPIYQQIAEAIGSLLANGVLPPRYVLQPERVLCAQFGISRMTLRQAMSLLDREGLINWRRGVGTVVTHRRLAKQQQDVRSFSEEIRARGGRPESRLISLDVAIPRLPVLQRHRTCGPQEQVNLASDGLLETVRRLAQGRYCLSLFP